MMDKSARIFVAGHTGMVGSAIVRRLEREGFEKLLLRTSAELDLRDQAAVSEFFASESPEYVFLAAARVGGILANNTFRAEFLYDNLLIASNVIHHSHLRGVKKLLFLGSSCIYPKFAPQPLREDAILSGYLEETNEPYAIAKIAGIKLCENYRRQYGSNFISVMPTNLYGPHDNFDLNTSHVMPALVKKFVDAVENGDPQVTVWGSGSPRREFLHVDDLADACLFLMEHYDEMEFINIGWGKDITILELAELIKKITNYEGEIRWDRSKPDGTPQKLLDVRKVTALKWKPKIELVDGIKSLVGIYKGVRAGG